MRSCPSTIHIAFSEDGRSIRFWTADAARAARFAQETGARVVQYQPAPAARPDGGGPARSAMREAVCLAHGWLWHATSANPRVHRAHDALRALMSRDDLAHGIRAARAAGATVDGAAVEAEMWRGIE